MAVLDEILIRIHAMGGKAAAGELGMAEGAMGKLSRVATAAFGAAGVAFGIKQAVDASANFNAAMERLQTQTGATTGEVNRMSKAALASAASLGTDPQALAASLYHVESAGFRGKAALDAMKIAAEGAKVGGADLTDTTTGLTAVMVAGFKGVDTLEKSMGALNATVGAGDMTFTDLNSALNTGILATFKAAGLQVKDFGAAMAVLGDNNIRGSRAANQLRTAITGIIGPSSVGVKILKELHLGPEEFANQLQKPNGLLKALELLKSHMTGLSRTQQEFDVVRLFGKSQSGPMLTLLNQMDRLKTKYEEVGKGQNKFNTDWDNTTKTLRFVLDQLKALGEVVLIKVGNALSAVIQFAIKHATVIKNLALSVAIVAAAWGLYTIAVNAASIAETIAIAGLYALDAVPVVAAIVAIVAVVYLLITHFKDVKKVVIDVFHAVVGALKAAWNWIKTAFMDVVNFIAKHWKLLAVIIFNVLGVIVDIVVTHWKAITHWVGGAISWIGDKFKWLPGVVKWVVDAVVNSFNWVKDRIKQVADLLWTIISTPFKWLWGKVVSPIMHWIVGAVQWMVDKVKKLLDIVLGPIKAVGHFIGGVVGTAGNVIGAVGGFLGLQSGGYTPTGGVFTVGERGPETLLLPPRSTVLPHGYAPASAGGPMENHVTLKIGQKEFARAIAWTTAKEKATH